MSRRSTAPVWPSHESIDGVQAACSRLSPRPYSRDDAREAIKNVARVVELLDRWAREDAQRGLGPLAGRLDDAHPSEPLE